MRDYIKEKLEDYIENEISYIEKENAICGFDKGRFKDLLMLETLNDKDKENIVNNILGDDGLEQTLNEVIHYYLYDR